MEGSKGVVGLGSGVRETREYKGEVDDVDAGIDKAVHAAETSGT